MFCTKCGNQIPDGSLVCPVCGNQLAAPQAAPAPQNQMGGRPQANITPQATPAPEQPKSAKPWFMFGRDNEN